MKRNIEKIYCCRFHVAGRSAVFIRLVRAERHLAIGREGRGADRSPAHTRERCGRRTPAISARRNRHAPPSALPHGVRVITRVVPTTAARFGEPSAAYHRGAPYASEAPVSARPHYAVSGLLCGWPVVRLQRVG